MDSRNPTSDGDLLSLSDFRRAVLRIGTIVAAEPIPGSTRLLAVTADLGTEQRQVVAGIAQAYAPAQLRGLQVAVAANLAPQAFGGVVAQVPFVDALTTILDPSLPLTVTEWEEWGNPLDDAQVYAYMKAYSPYENVSDQTYPPILAVTSLNDTRVLYHEPAKWVARLRATGRGGPFLLKTEMTAGHGGRSGRYDAWREEAMILAWIITTATAAQPGGTGPG